MRLLFKQRFFSWFDNYDIYDDNGATVFTVEGRSSRGAIAYISSTPPASFIGTVQQRVLTFLPKLTCMNSTAASARSKKGLRFCAAFHRGGQRLGGRGQFMEWDYTIVSASRGTVATIGKELFHWTDTYVIDVADPADALHALMVVLAIDAEKYSRSN